MDLLPMPAETSTAHARMDVYENSDAMQPLSSHAASSVTYLLAFISRRRACGGESRSIAFRFLLFFAFFVCKVFEFLLYNSPLVAARAATSCFCIFVCFCL